MSESGSPWDRRNYYRSETEPHRGPEDERQVTPEAGSVPTLVRPRELGRHPPGPTGQDDSTPRADLDSPRHPFRCGTPHGLRDSGYPEKTTQHSRSP